MSGRLPVGWVTDVAVLEHMGSTLEDRGDHLVVRTPQNPTFHWGNGLLVTDPAAADDVERWLRTFAEAFPGADWVTLGLARLPADEAPWRAHGLELGLDEVLSTATLPRQTRLAPGYAVRRLAGGDWEQSVAKAMRDNEETGEYERGGHETFVRARMAIQRAMCDRGAAAFFGAFADGLLVSELGIVRCGATARYQNVGTDAGHRRRGLASHLLGVAARWAGDRGCDRWVIVTESVNPAGRVYRGVGFDLDVSMAQAYRPPPRPAS